MICVKTREKQFGSPTPTEAAISAMSLIGETERTFGELHAYLVDVDVDINAGAPLEDAAEVGIAAMAELGQRGDGDAAL